MKQVKQISLSDKFRAELKFLGIPEPKFYEEDGLLNLDYDYKKLTNLQIVLENLISRSIDTSLK